MPEAPTRRPFMERELLDRMLDGIAAGSYHLVLGAGASAGVHNGAGPLPLAAGLTKMLLGEIGGGTPSVANITLQRAFARAVATQGEESIVGLMRLRFAGCTPAEWQMDAATVPWQAIWTLNVDDSMEFAYANQQNRAQVATTFLWSERPSPLGGRTDSVPIVHLHGYAGDLSRRDDPALVFSMQQYLGALRDSDRGNWQTRFRGEYPTAPVIVIGARLTDELDLAGVIEEGNFSHEFGLPSVIVRPGMSDFERAEYLS